MEKIEGIRFRNRIQSTFYNTDEIVNVDYQIIDLRKSVNKPYNSQNFFYLTLYLIKH